MVGSQHSLNFYILSHIANFLGEEKSLEELEGKKEDDRFKTECFVYFYCIACSIFLIQPSWR